MSEFRHWHRNRLLKLARLLNTKKVAAHFNLNNWLTGELKDLVSKKKDCGTTACAVGWACTIPQFRKAGLRIYNNPLYSDYWPDSKGTLGFAGVCKFFGLSNDEAMSLFHPQGYSWVKVTPTDVADKIRLLLKEKAKTQSSLV